ncbi:MAG: helix-turn-helix transcriptional regulator [Candidatus Helarchaeota archaeon]
MKEVTEKDAYEAIRSAGSKGMLQSELWRCLNTNSREGSRIATKLEKKGLVRRSRELRGGRWTYRLYIDEKVASPNILWCTLNQCPCFTCEHLARCGSGHNHSPNTCSLLDSWLLDQVEENNGRGSSSEEEEPSSN